LTPGPTRAIWSESSGERSPSISSSPLPHSYVDLFLAVFGVVVLRVILKVGRQIDDLDVERLDPSAPPHTLEGTQVDRLHLVDLPHRVSCHLAPPG
jgi:hypothetical protein